MSADPAALDAWFAAVDRRAAHQPGRAVPETTEATHEHLTNHRPFGAQRADALRLLAETFLERKTAKHGSVADRYQVTVHIDQRLLARAEGCDPEGSRHADSWRDASSAAASLDTEVLKHCELEGADRPLAIETARRLACDASLVGIVDDAQGEPLSVGRRTRSIPPALQRALNVRDGGCRFPGCGRTRFTEGHHIVHWADGGKTELANLVTLCRFHHRLVHEGEFGLQASAGAGDVAGAAERGRFVFTRPDGSRIEPNGRRAVRAGPVTRPDGTTLEPEDVETEADVAAAAGMERLLFELNRQAGLEIDAQTARCGWRGETMDYSAAIEAMQFWRGRRS